MRNQSRFITTPKHRDGQGGDTTQDFVTVVLFSENHGYRMKSYGPVSLIRLGDKTILESQIEAIKACFVNFEIIVCSGFETQKTVNFIKDKFPEINIRVVENQVHFNTNCCESARLCLNNTLNDKILFCSGFNLIRPHHLKKLDLEISCILTQDGNEDLSFEINAIANNGVLEQFSLGLKQNFWTEVFYLSGSGVIKSFYNILSSPEYKNRFLFEAINDVSKKHDIVNVAVDIPVRKVNNIKTFKRMAEI